MLIDVINHYLCGRSSPLRKESRSPFQNLVGTAQLTVLLLQLLRLRSLSCRHARGIPGIDLSLPNPTP
jgi:hypothetical protein